MGLLRELKEKRNPVRSVEVGPKRHDGGRPRRNANYPDELIGSIRDGAQTVHGEIRRSMEEYPDKNCMGYRVKLGSVKKEISIVKGDKTAKKVVDVPKMTNFQWVTYREFGRLVTNFGSGLMSLGVKKGDILCIFLDGCPEWQVCSVSSMERGVVVSTVYASLGQKALVYALDLVKVTCVFTSAALLKTRFHDESDQNNELLAAKVKTLKLIIYTGELADDELAEIEKHTGDIEIRSYKQVCETGVAKNVPVEESGDIDDLALIMFTSGSTGHPKGVKMSHRNLLASSAGLLRVVQACKFSPEDRYLGYLPLAHILEFNAEVTCFQVGASVGYGSPQTLQGESCLDEKEQPAGDIAKLKPTVMPAVPLILDRMRKGVIERVKASGFMKQKIFEFAYYMKRRNYLAGESTQFWDKLVFDSIRRNLGGELRVICSGGAPLSPESQEFTNITFCCPVAQGYGSTETSSSGTVTDLNDVTTGRVGPPMPSIEIRLLDVPDMGYLSRDEPNPRGEILMRGPGVCLGYYNSPEEEVNCFIDDPDGEGKWYHTGDIGMWHPDGTLQIIDRKKDLIKLSDGEYIALGALEAVYKQCRYVEHILVFASSLQRSPVSLIVPNEKEIHKLAKSLDIKGSFSDLVNEEKIISAIFEDVLSVGRSAKLKRCEMLLKITLISDEWTPANGLLTEAMKLKRNVLNRKYDHLLNAMY